MTFDSFRQILNEVKQKLNYTIIDFDTIKAKEDNNLNDNSKQNVRLIRINRQIQDVKYCSNSLR